MSIITISGGVTAPKGYTASAVHCGIRKNRTKKDLALIVSQVKAAAAAVYTQNKVKGAPLTATKANLADGHACAVICNSGNANTCNADGIDIANRMCALLANALHINPTDVIVASTGVIGQPLPIAPIEAGIGPLVAALSPLGSADAVEGIMTTDLKPKEVAVEFELGGKPCRIGAIAKGSGMIHPNMATMLGFVTSDVAITPAMLQKALTLSVQDTYNMVSVDGDTSTNDMVSAMANGLAGNPLIDADGPDFHLFLNALTAVNAQMAKLIAADGEGATKLLVVNVTGAADLPSARSIAKSIVCSNLTKAALFGADANWGRVLCAIGYADATVSIDKVAVAFSSSAGTIDVCQKGAGLPFDEAAAKAILSENEITILVTLEDGAAAATAYGCDLTYDYVKINGDYRT